MKKSFVSSINYTCACEILSALMDKNTVNAIRKELANNDKPCELHNIRRVIVSEIFGVNAKTVIYVDAWATMLKVRKGLFSPDDYGKDGKYAEIRDRLELYKMNGQTKTTWSEFNAHKSGKKDIVDRIEKINIEKKTGVGDWLYSKRYSTLDGVRREYERKENDVIRWDYEKRIVKEATKRKPQREIILSIHWEKSWSEFFTILEGFNGDINTWFKPVKETENGYCFQLQEIQTSEKKIEYLMQYNNR